MVKRFGFGTFGVGIVGLGWALSVGIVSLGVNAVGWVAIGVNAVGFVALGLVNAIGVLAFGGVNSYGGWGRGGTNTGGSGILGLGVSALVAVGFLVARVRTWPRDDPTGAVPLDAVLGAEGQWVHARLGEIGKEVSLEGRSTTIRALASADLAARCAALGRATAVRVRVRLVVRPVEAAGYREEAATHVYELVEVVAEPRMHWLRRALGDLLGVQLALAMFGLVASVVAFIYWP